MTNWPKNEWMDQWQALSRQYWNAWQDLTREAGAAGADPASVPWHEGFEQWSRMFAGAGKQSETIERVLASARSFSAFAQSMIAAATAGAAGAGPNWTETLRNGFHAPGSASLFANPVAEALREISGQGVRSFEQMMQGVAPDFDPAREAKSWLRVPAFGFLREHQEHYQRMASAMIDYQEQNTRYGALILKASQRGFELFESKLAAREEPGRQIDSLRALYDLWVDAAEEAYAEIALSPEFREVYGALVNAQMRVRSQIQQEVERIATDFGMPTRTELDSIGQRLHDLRRELRGGNAVGGAQSSLAREVADLRREVAALKAALAEKAAPARDPAPRRAAKAKKAPRKRRPAPKKRAQQVVALRADLRESVSAPAAEAKSARPAPSPASTAPAHAGKAARAVRARPARAKKSVAKVAHSPSRSSQPVASFATRMAEFARTAHRANARAPSHNILHRHARTKGR
jgi:poly[(R)-3-hydroxyalkanoate] polymerase subunit PhaE